MKSNSSMINKINTTAEAEAVDKTEVELSSMERAEDRTISTMIRIINSKEEVAITENQEEVESLET